MDLNTFIYGIEAQKKKEKLLSTLGQNSDSTLYQIIQYARNEDMDALAKIMAKLIKIIDK